MCITWYCSLHEGRILNVETLEAKLIGLKPVDPEHMTWSLFVDIGISLLNHFARVYYVKSALTHHEQIGWYWQCSCDCICSRYCPPGGIGGVAGVGRDDSGDGSRGCDV